MISVIFRPGPQSSQSIRVTERDRDRQRDRQKDRETQRERGTQREKLSLHSTRIFVFRRRKSNHLLSEHDVSPLVTTSASTCSPSRQTDKSPIVSVGSLSPTSCKVITTSSTKKEKKLCKKDHFFLCVKYFTRQRIKDL